MRYILLCLFALRHSLLESLLHLFIDFEVEYTELHVYFLFCRESTTSTVSMTTTRVSG